MGHQPRPHAHRRRYHGLYVTGPDGLPLTQLRFDATQRYYHHDQLGSTRALTTANGAVVARSDYDPYGNPTTATTPSNPFGYAGQYTDHATGLIYMRARWYDPQTGQFITSDPIGHASGETNLYRYAAGDPANLIDPSGLSVWDAIAGLDYPISQAVAGALNSAFFNAPAKLFGFDPACVGGAFNFGSTYLSLAVPFPGGKLAAAEKLAARGSSCGRAWRSSRWAERLGCHRELGARAATETRRPPEISSGGSCSLRDELQQSVQKRIEKTVELGADGGHSDRLAKEQALIKSIDKHLADR